jgi:hypothetical protein
LLSSLSLVKNQLEVHLWGDHVQLFFRSRMRWGRSQ